MRLIRWKPRKSNSTEAKKIKGEKIQLIFKKNSMYYHKKKIKRKTPVMTLVTGVRVYRYLTSLPAEFLKKLLTPKQRENRANTADVNNSIYCI